MALERALRVLIVLKQTGWSLTKQPERSTNPGVSSIKDSLHARAVDGPGRSW